MLKNGSKIDIRKRYAVIGGDEEARRGIVTAKSDLCKARGVKTADTLYSARRKCPYLDVYNGDYAVFKKYSDMMYNYLLNYTDVIERYSIDECFLDYTGSVKLFGDPIKIAYKIKDEINVGDKTLNAKKFAHLIRNKDTFLDEETISNFSGLLSKLGIKE